VLLYEVLLPNLRVINTYLLIMKDILSEVGSLSLNFSERDLIL